MIDPYASAIVARGLIDAIVKDNADQELRMPRYLGVVSEAAFDWQDARRSHHPWRDTIIYETHVRGLTMHPSSAAQHRGQYLGVVEKIPYLKSRDVPMLLGGDEFRRTQRGNNNAYCQDNELSWYDRTLCTQNAGLVRFVSRLIQLRLSHPVLREDRFYTANEVQWFGPTGATPDWHGPKNRLGCIIRDADVELCVLFNADAEATQFVIPAQTGRRYRICIDTSRAAPDDAPDPDHAVIIDANIVKLSGRHAIVTRTL